MKPGSHEATGAFFELAPPRWSFPRTVLLCHTHCGVASCVMRWVRKTYRHKDQSCNPRNQTSKRDSRHAELQCFPAYIFAIRGEGLPGPLRRDSENRIAPVLFHRVPTKKLVLQMGKSEKCNSSCLKTSRASRQHFQIQEQNLICKFWKKAWIREHQGIY
jgi:hypothetical protein